MSSTKKKRPVERGWLNLVPILTYCGRTIEDGHVLWIENSNRDEDHFIALYPPEGRPVELRFRRTGSHRFELTEACPANPRSHGPIPAS